MNKAIVRPEMRDESRFFFEPDLSHQDEQQIYKTLYQELIQMHQDMMGGITEDGQIIFRNENFQKTFCGGNASPGDSFFSLVFPDDLPLARDQIGMTDSDGNGISFTCRMITADETVMLTSWKVKANPQQGERLPYHYLLIGHEMRGASDIPPQAEEVRSSLNDLVLARNSKFKEIQQSILEEISKRKVIERRMDTLISEVESEVIRLREILKNTPELLFVFDREGTLQYINDRGAEYLGSSIHYLIGMNKNELGFNPEIIELLSDFPDLSVMAHSAYVGEVCSGGTRYDYYLVYLQDVNGFSDSTLLVLRPRPGRQQRLSGDIGSTLMEDFLPVRRLAGYLDRMVVNLRDCITGSRR